MEESDMYKLSLPPISPLLKQHQGKTWIFDPIRKKHVVLTPEEWVRQHFISYLIDDMQYPKALFSVEKSLTYNTRKKRFDILIYDHKALPWMLVECKSPQVSLKQEAFNQIMIYNMTVGAQYLSVTNGMVHYCWRASQKKGGKPILLNHLPSFV